MANTGEALITSLAGERLEAIKKILPVRDSVRQKLQARQETKVEFATGAEELFKPVTTATEMVKTAIIGKPDPTDPDRPQQSLFQAIEQLRKDQSKPIKGFNYKTSFTEDFTDQIKQIPIRNRDDLITFGPEAASAFHSKREQHLKNPDPNVGKQQFPDGVFKIKR